MVGLFVYDANSNGESDFGSVFNTSFIRGTDVFLSASPPKWMDLEWTNEDGVTASMKVPNWPSDETLVSIVLP